MGLTVASYNVCQQIILGIFSVSESGAYQIGQSAGDPCNNCGEYMVATATSPPGSMSITIPYSSLIYAPENIWIAVMGQVTSLCSSAPATLTFTFYNSSGNEIGSYSFTVFSGASYVVSSPVPSGTDTIIVTASAEAPTCPGVQAINVWVTDIYFYSQPPVYYIEPLFFYNQTLTYSIPLNITTSDYLALWVISGGSSGLTSYSACIVASNSTFCANTQFFSGESSISAFQVTGNANNTYQVTWSQELVLIFVNTSCGLDNIFLFEVTGYNNILNPAEYIFTIQTPFNG